MATEIEIRGKISKIEFEKLLVKLEKEGKAVDHYLRLSVDVSPGFDATSKTWKNLSGMDIRLKKSGEKEKISIKTGDFHTLERKEVEVKLQTGQFLNALDLLETMGFSSGMVYFWESWEYLYQGVEIKLSKYSEDYFTFEIEGKENVGVEEMAKELGLSCYDKEDYRRAIDWENLNIHKEYTRELVEKMLEERF